MRRNKAVAALGVLLVWAVAGIIGMLIAAYVNGERRAAATLKTLDLLEQTFKEIQEVSAALKVSVATAQRRLYGSQIRLAR